MFTASLLQETRYMLLQKNQKTSNNQAKLLNLHVQTLMRRVVEAMSTLMHFMLRFDH